MRFPKFFIKILVISLIIYDSCTSLPRYRAEKGREIRKTHKHHTSSGKNVVIGKASFYGKKFNGRKTANGEIFNMYKLSAAHLTYPFNTKLRVTNLSNGKSVIVRVNDRGPYVKGRILDLSYGAAKKIGMIKKGIADVKIEVLEWGKN